MNLTTATLVKLLSSAILLSGATVTFNFFSHNQVTTTNVNNPGNLEQQKVTKKTSARCLKESDNNFIVASQIGTTEKPLIRIETGQDFWGDEHTKEQRCMSIVAQYNHAKLQGATGWGVAVKNEYPIICAATKDGCILDQNKQYFQLATFKPSVNPKPLVEKLINQTNPNYEGSPDDAGVIATQENFSYFDIEK